MVDFTKFIENQGKAGTKYEQIFGSEDNVNRMASIWENNAGLFQLAMLASIQDYAQEYSFSREEYDAFSIGLASVPDLMQKCLEEREEKIRKKKEESSEGSSG